MKWNFENTAYDELYLDGVMKVHESLFRKLAEIKEYDIFSMIDVYMQHSEIRHKMDKGNWSALNKGYRQLMNDVDYSLCSPKQTESDDILLGWIADMYVLLQWIYNLPSAYINMKLSSSELAGAYNPLHETSYKNACEKLYHKYLR
ncbi:MAG: hypothetical protein K2J32_07250 [Ruminococcus sp.]|nr:hypothetical protein [Ruminococcus sp.]